MAINLHPNSIRQRCSLYVGGLFRCICSPEWRLRRSGRNEFELLGGFLTCPRALKEKKGLITGAPCGRDRVNRNQDDDPVKDLFVMLNDKR